MTNKKPDQERDRLLSNLSQLIAGLAVPISMRAPLGKATPAWIEIHSQLVGFGWTDAEQYERELRKVLGLPALAPAAADAEG